MRVRSLDHLGLTVSDPEATVAFYERLGMRLEEFGEGRLSLRFGEQKINLHVAGSEFEPHAVRPVPGSADVCLLLEGPLADAQRDLEAAGIPVELGPIERTGATRAIRSVYVRDPDGNLVELSEPV
jgi:catechol 2,3-dioxygenase-like lactoylglutathione lyase family enzyme